ncbi:hypothetical protein V8C37DRAFT_376327 [Trichoderma ceciliae]
MEYGQGKGKRRASREHLFVSFRFVSFLSFFLFGSTRVGCLWLEAKMVVAVGSTENASACGRLGRISCAQKAWRLSRW